MKDFWIKTSYYWFLFMLFIVGLFCGGLKVNASAYQTFSVSQVRMRYDERGTLKWTSWYDTNHTFDNLTFPVSNLQFRVKSSDGFSPLETYVLNFGYKPIPDAISRTSVNARKDGQSDVYETFSCNWVRGDVTYLATCNWTPKLTFTSSEYLIINIDFQEAYLTSIRGIQNQYLERESVESVITQTTDNIVNSVENVNDTLTNDDVDNPGSDLSDMESLLPSNGVITQLIGLPILIYSKVLTSINGTCNSFNLGSLYNTNLIIPCIEPGSYLGNNVWNIIDLIISGGFVLVIARKMIKAFESFTSLKEGDVIND